MEQVSDSAVTTLESIQAEEPPPGVEKVETLELKTAALETLSESAGPTDLENELANLNGSEEGPGLDELSTLEREIAKLHNIRPPDAASEVKDSDTPIALADNGGLEPRQAPDEAKCRTPIIEEGNAASGNGQSSESPLEEVDLIALLKGTDTSHDQPTGEEKCTLEKALSELDGVGEDGDVGVTIEGEGQFEIMEIDDDEGESSSRKASPKVPASKPIKSNSLPSISKHKLSPEQARAVALEQMAGLKPKSRRKEPPAPPSVVAPIDIVSSLNDDWDDYDSEEDKSASALVTEVITLPSAHVVTKKPPLPVKKLSSPVKHSPNSAILLNNKISGVKVMLKTVSQKQLAASTGAAAEKTKPTVVVSPPKETEEHTTGTVKLEFIKSLLTN